MVPPDNTGVGSALHYSILERFSQGKGGGAYTEDRLVETPGVFGILDGSIGPEGDGPELITQILDTAVETLRALPENIGPEALIDTLTEQVSEQKHSSGRGPNHLTGGYVFCLYSRHHSEIWRVGDCKFRNGGTPNDAVFEPEMTSARARAMIINARLADGATPEEIIASPDYPSLVNGLLYEQARLLNRANHPLSMGAINGDTVPRDRIERFMARKGVLAITSDGYPDIGANLADTERRLQDLLHQDPLSIGVNLQCKGRLPGHVSFDDRSYISARLQPEG